MIKRLAIIPARGGSKRIKNKNIKNFCGKPMLYYPITTLKKSKLFSKIHVSTDDEKIVDVVENLDLKVDFKRPSNLADDYTPIMPVLKYVVNRYKDSNLLFDEVWLIMACNPFLFFEDLISASILFQKKRSHSSLIAVTEYPAPIEWAFSLNKKSILKPISPGKFLIRSQDIEKTYYDAGSFAIFTSDQIEKINQEGSDLNHIGYVLTKGSTVDIDDNNDWALAEKLFKNRM